MNKIIGSILALVLMPVWSAAGGLIPLNFDNVRPLAGGQSSYRSGALVPDHQNQGLADVVEADDQEDPG